MSEDSFDESLLEDYDEPQESLEDETQESKGSVWKGVGVGLIVTVLFELGVGLALDVQGSLVDRYIAYLLGLVPIFIAAFYTRSVWKMFFIGAPVLVVTSFALPFFLPDVFSGLMTPFLTLVPIIERAQQILTNAGQLDEDFNMVSP